MILVMKAIKQALGWFEKLLLKKTFLLLKILSVLLIKNQKQL